MEKQLEATERALEESREDLRGEEAPDNETLGERIDLRRLEEQEEREALQAMVREMAQVEQRTSSITNAVKRRLRNRRAMIVMITVTWMVYFLVGIHYVTRGLIIWITSWDIGSLWQGFESGVLGYMFTPLAGAVIVWLSVRTARMSGLERCFQLKRIRIFCGEIEMTVALLMLWLVTMAGLYASAHSSVALVKLISQIRAVQNLTIWIWGTLGELASMHMVEFCCIPRRELLAEEWLKWSEA